MLLCLHFKTLVAREIRTVISVGLRSVAEDKLIPHKPICLVIVCYFPFKNKEWSG